MKSYTPTYALDQPTPLTISILMGTASIEIVTAEDLAWALVAALQIGRATA